jgi:hypothetical protein
MVAGSPGPTSAWSVCYVNAVSTSLALSQGVALAGEICDGYPPPY